MGRRVQRDREDRALARLSRRFGFVAGTAIVAATLVLIAVPRRNVPLPPSGGDDAQAWFWNKRQLPKGMAPGVLDRALAEVRRFGRGRVGIQPRLTTPNNPWLSAGPRPIATTSGVDYVGRVLAIAAHPSDANTILVGAALGGVWKTTDGGASWRSVLGDVVYPAISGLDFDPVDPRVVYASTSGRGPQNAKLFQSLDTGDSWRELPLPFEPASSLVTITVSKIAVDPATAGTAESTSVYALGTAGVPQLIRSDSAGRSGRVLFQGVQLNDFIVDRQRPSRLFLLARDTNLSCTTQCLVLERSDNGGLNWTRNVITGASGFDYAKIAQSASSPDTLIAAFLDRALSQVRVFLSRDAGTTWQEKTSSEKTVSGQWPLTVSIHPTDPNSFVVGNVNLLRSSDGGTTWGLQSVPHVDQTFTTFDAAGRLLSGNDGGIYRQGTGGGAFASLNPTLSITQAYSVAAHPLNGLTFVSGTQDTGTIQYAAPLGWRTLTGGDGGAVGFDGSTPPNTYAETQWYNGSFSFYRCQFGNCNLRTSGIDKNMLAAFIPKFALDPLEPATLWLCAGRMLRTDTRGDSWTAVGPSVTGMARCPADWPCVNDAYFTTVAVAPSNSNVVYAGTLRGNIFTTTDRGVTWQTTESGLPPFEIESIAVDPSNPDIAYATQSGFAPSGKVFKTIDRGRSWSNISQSLASMPVNTIVIDPDTNPRVLYIGTDIGVFRGTDHQTVVWEYFNDGMPPVIINELSYSRTTGTLAAATMGRGIWLITPRLSR